MVERFPKLSFLKIFGMKIREIYAICQMQWVKWKVLDIILIA